MRPEPRVLVGTLYSGEREFERSVTALRKQSYRRFEQCVLRDLPNKEAHDRLYRTFMEAAEEFDLFLKLDADMVLRHPRILEAIVALFRADPELDHLELSVQDWFTRAPMIGLHVYSQRARWAPSGERLFVDTRPRYPGHGLQLWREPAPAALHAPDPSSEQAWAFGVHRALKAVQPGRTPEAFELYQSWRHFRFLRRTWEHYRVVGDPRLALALLGAEAVFEGRSALRTLETKEAAGEGSARPEDLARLRQRWAHPRLREMGHDLRAVFRFARRASASGRRRARREERFQP